MRRKRVMVIGPISPGFAKVFRCPVICIINKIDLIPENEKVCIRQLKKIGVREPYYKISSLFGTGICALKNNYLRSKGDEE